MWTKPAKLLGGRNQFSMRLIWAGVLGYGCFLGLIDRPAWAQQERRAQYAAYAAQHMGDAGRGEAIFRQEGKSQCTSCHAIVGMEKSGPNLEGVGDKFTRPQLIQQILDPSAEIKPGFEQVKVLTESGHVVTGRLERANRLIHRIITAEGQQVDVKTSEIVESKTSNESMMPDGLEQLLTAEQFADLIAYLQSLKFQEHSGYVADNRVIEIPRLAAPISFRAIHPPELAFENPVWCGALPGTERDLVVVEHQSSSLWRLVREAGEVRKELFLDLSEVTHISNNQGLMCVAFHPHYPDVPRYFVEYEVHEDSVVKTTVAERVATADGLSDSGLDSRRLLEVEQPAFNHNGGCIAFGPDGMLYIAFGDGGPQRDPNGYAQDPRHLLGSMLRIDVDRRDDGLPYAIPADNPFRAAHRADPAVYAETWAIGFREPWRFSFDFATGELYVGDVGQSRFEEICLVEAGQNHGWNVKEAFEGFSEEYRRAEAVYAEPLFAYPHGLGFSVTGGYVYRGHRAPSFAGVYLFGDYNTRRVWGLRQQDGVVDRVVEIGTAPGGIASFGVDQTGEIYLVTYGGTIYHMDLTKTAFPAD